jgi:hypothetical protein
LRVVFSGAAVVYERMRALARIRWEGSAVVVRSSRERVHMLLSGVDARRLILSADGPTGSGGTAEVTILEDSGDVVRARVDARGDGYLFVADPIQYGWKATIDGAPAPLVAADHAGAAVHVPAGKHEVSIRYVPPGRRTGMGLTAVSLATVGVVLAATTRRRKRVPDVVV